MSVFRRLRRGVHRLVFRREEDRGLDDELGHYFAESAAAHEARGLSPEEARRAARLEMGSAVAAREEVRAFGWESVVETAARDGRLALRRLAKEPGFTLLAAATLAVGIGAATAIVSAASPVLFRPLPYPEADRILAIWDKTSEGARADVTFGTAKELEVRARSLGAIAVWKAWTPTLAGSAEPERLEGASVSRAYFRVLGVAPRLGRDFLDAEDRPNGPRVVVLSHRLFLRRFGGDTAIVGRAVVLDGDAYTVAGVLPPDLEDVLAPRAELYAPLQYDMSLGSAWGHHLRMAGRLAPDASLEGARRELDAIAKSPVPDFPRVVWASLRRGLVAERLQEDVTRGIRPALLALLGAALLLLVIANVNVTNLLLARGARRRGELAVRAALGAGRGRLLAQLLTESLLLAALGGALGIGVAALFVKALVALAPDGVPRLSAVRLDGGAIAFGALLSALAGLAAGAVPALQASRRGGEDAPHLGSPRATGAPRALRSALVVCEVALALVLLVGSGLLLRSLARLLSVPPGFDADGLVTMRLQTSGRRFDADGSGKRFFARVLEETRGLPGVESAALTSQLPLSGDLDVYGVHFEANEVPRDEGDHSTLRYGVSDGFFAAMRIPLLRGRLLDARDRDGAPLVAVVSESLAKSRLRGVEPIGRRLRIGPADSAPFTVVGVVGDLRQTSLALQPQNAVYTSFTQWRFDEGAMSLVVRSKEDAGAVAAAVRRIVRALDRDQPVVRVASMPELVAASAAERRFTLLLLEAFALAALVLAGAGIYGVLAGSVAERTREIGVRTALGATRGDVLGLVLLHGAELTALGAAAGVLASAAATRVLGSMLFGVSPLDPATYAAVVLALVAVAALACAVPAWRAARVDPAVTLRAE